MPASSAAGEERGATLIDTRNERKGEGDNESRNSKWNFNHLLNRMGLLAKKKQNGPVRLRGKLGISSFQPPCPGSDDILNKLHFSIILANT
jgi:hypothetical protein